LFTSLRKRRTGYSSRLNLKPKIFNILRGITRVMFTKIAVYLHRFKKDLNLIRPSLIVLFAIKLNYSVITCDLCLFSQKPSHGSLR